jgi:hypothetical protein
MKHGQEIQAIDWPLARIEEAISAIGEDEQRERLHGCCKAIWEFCKKAFASVKKADRPGHSGQP